MVTVEQYREAIKTRNESIKNLNKAHHIINQYTAQTIRIKQITSRKVALLKTPKQLGFCYSNWKSSFPNISVRLMTILKSYFEDYRICDIVKEEFLLKKGAGITTWNELCYLKKKPKANIYNYGKSR